MSVISIKNLQKSFGDVKALQDINFDVDEGEVLGFIGPNGAGKSTTIRILLGILKASGGSALVFGKDSWKDSLEIHKRISYVPGDVNLWPNLTGGEVIDLLLSLQGTKNSSKRDVLIKRFDLDPTKKARTYSKGNRQKVAIIAALASEADLYIFDEPTSGLDPLMAQVFQDCVLELKQAGKSIILSSHILSEVEKLCDRVAIIRDGVIVDIGTLAQLRHLTKTNLLIQTEQSIAPLKGRFAYEGSDTDFKVSIDSTQTSEVIRLLAPYGVKHVENVVPTLEELFLKHYDNEGDHNA